MLATDIDSATASAAAAGGAEKREYVKRIFSEIAPRYDLLNHVLSLNIDRRWRRKAIATLGVERDQAGRYLDLCAGTMDVAAEISRLAGFRGMVIGADFAEPMLRAGALCISSPAMECCTSSTRPLARTWSHPTCSTRAKAGR